MRIFWLILICCYLTATGGDIISREGEVIGYATVSQKGSGLLLKLTLQGLKSGWHGMHIHAVGTCEDYADGFIKSGSHFNPEKKTHGVFDNHGYHAGDLANIYVDKSGAAHIEQIIPNMSSVYYREHFSSVAAALIIHSGPDDYTTQPTGDSGARVACAVLSPSAGK